MKIDIVLSGVGGQGILSIAASIGMAALEHGLYLKQAEVHGMSQRGGAVQSHLRIRDNPVTVTRLETGIDLLYALEGFNRKVIMAHSRVVNRKRVENFQIAGIQS